MTPNPAFVYVIHLARQFFDKMAFHSGR